MTAVTSAVSFLVACLCGMGAGGGGLMVLYLTAMLKISQAEAQGINLLFFLSASAGSFFVNLKNGRIRLLRITLLILFGIPLAFLGSKIASEADAALLRRAYGGLLCLSGIYFFLTAHKKK